jgi:hypothetical protein
MDLGTVHDKQELQMPTLKEVLPYDILGDEWLQVKCVSTVRCCHEHGKMFQFGEVYYVSYYDKVGGRAMFDPQLHDINKAYITDMHRDFVLESFELYEPPKVIQPTKSRYETLLI